MTDQQAAELMAARMAGLTVGKRLLAKHRRVGDLVKDYLGNPSCMLRIVAEVEGDPVMFQGWRANLRDFWVVVEPRP